MANTRSGNTFYVDSTSAAGDASSFISEKNLKLVGVFYQVAATTDVIILYDKNSLTAAAGFQKLKLVSSTAGDTKFFRCSDQSPIFSNGVWVVLTGSPTCTLVFSQ